MGAAERRTIFRERVKRLLADEHGVRIADIEEADVDQFLKHMRKHGMVLLMDEAILR